MDAPPRQAFALSLLLRASPWIVLLAMLGLTAFAWDHERMLARTSLHTQFDAVLRETVGRMEQRVQGYEQIMRGVQAHLATGSLRERASLHHYVEGLQLDANFSGVQTIGVIEWVSDSARQEHEAAMRKAGFADYAIAPAGQRPAYAPVVQREPYIGVNRTAPGFDVWSDATRRAAMQRARDSGLPAISGKLALVEDGAAATEPSFIMYAPVYALGRPRDTMQQRNQALQGWVYAAFHMNDFMASLYGSLPPGLEIEIFDGTETEPASRLYQGGAVAAKSPADSLRATEYMVVSGHNWTLLLHAREAFLQQYGRSVENQIAAAGSLLSVVLALLIWQMVNAREQALQLAHRMTEELRHMAQHDPLTGLANRALFSDRVSQEIALAKRQRKHFALLFIDLDNFKQINDTFGHAGGDRILQRTAKLLQDSVREADSVGRLGGDEFVILLPQLTDADSVMDLADKLRRALREPFQIDGQTVTMSCSMGIAVYPQDGVDELTLTKNADEAMYRAKAEGRDCIRTAVAAPGSTA